MTKYQIILEAEAKKNIEYFKKKYPAIAIKIKDLLIDLQDDPFSVIGKPEPLKFNLSGYWSKRITREHRLIYKVKNKIITVISCRYHY